MKLILIRVVSGVFGLVAAIVAIGAPLSFLVLTATEIESMKQYHGRISIVGAIGALLLVVSVTALFGVGAYRLLRRAARNT